MIFCDNLYYYFKFSQRSLWSGFLAYEACVDSLAKWMSMCEKSIFSYIFSPRATLLGSAILHLYRHNIPNLIWNLETWRIWCNIVHMKSTLPLRRSICQTTSCPRTCHILAYWKSSMFSLILPVFSFIRIGNRVIMPHKILHL